MNWIRHVMWMLAVYMCGMITGVLALFDLTGWVMLSGVLTGLVMVGAVVDYHGCRRF